MKDYKAQGTPDTHISFEEVKQAALTLSPGDRAMLIDHLLQSLDPPNQKEIDAAWCEEIERRMLAIDEGRVDLIPGEEVLKQLRSRFK